MKKLIFFFRLNYKDKDKARGLPLFFVFVITACMLSASFFIRKNNSLFYGIQLNNILENDIYETNIFISLTPKNRRNFAIITLALSFKIII